MGKIEIPDDQLAAVVRPLLEQVGAELALIYVTPLAIFATYASAKNERLKL